MVCTKFLELELKNLGLYSCSVNLTSEGNICDVMGEAMWGSGNSVRLVLGVPV